MELNPYCKRIGNKHMLLRLLKIFKSSLFLRTCLSKTLRDNNSSILSQHSSCGRSFESWRLQVFEDAEHGITKSREFSRRGKMLNNPYVSSISHLLYLFNVSTKIVLGAVSQQEINKNPHTCLKAPNDDFPTELCPMLCIDRGKVT